MLTNLSIAKRLGLGFALILLLSLVAILVGVFQLYAVAHATEQMVQSPVRTERLVSDWYRNVHTGVRRTAAIARSSDPSLGQFFAEDTAEATKLNNELQKELEALMQSELDRKLFNEIGEQRKIFISTRDQIIALKKEGKA